VILLLAQQSQWRKVLQKVLSFIVIAALVFSFATAASAGYTKKQGATSTSVGTNQPKKMTYGRGMQAHLPAARCPEAVNPTTSSKRPPQLAALSFPASFGILESVAAQQQDFCSCIGTALLDLRLAISGLSSANPGLGRLSQQSIFEPGEPQRVNACGFLTRSSASPPWYV
jgi:hypothetical protein